MATEYSLFFLINIICFVSIEIFLIWMNVLGYFIQSFAKKRINIRKDRSVSSKKGFCFLYDMVPEKLTPLLLGLQMFSPKDTCLSPVKNVSCPTAIYRQDICLLVLF